MNYLKLFLSVLTITCFACIACGEDDDLCTEITWYQDADGDGLGNPDAILTACEQPTDYVANSDDDNDTGTDNERYNAAVFSDVSLTSDIAYGMNTTQAGVETTLLMDIYEPTGDTENSRPLVILAHGGGFTGGSKTNNSIVKTAEYLAKSGYVVASISYRLIDAAGDNVFYIGAKYCSIFIIIITLYLLSLANEPKKTIY